MPIRLFLLCFFLALPGTCVRAQTVVTGRVTDAQSGAVLPYVTLGLVGTPRGTTAAADGRFTLRLRRLPARVAVSQVGYRPDTVLITTADYLEVELARNADLPAVEVVATRRWRVINKDRTLPLDFTVRRGRLYVLGKRGVGKRYHLAAHDAGGRIRTERTLHFGGVRGLTTNCLDHLTLLTADYAVRLDAATLEPIEKMPLADYDALFADCRAATDSLVYLERSDYEGFRKLYLVGERTTGQFGLFRRVEDRARARELVSMSPWLAQETDNANSMGDVYWQENAVLRHRMADADFEKAIRLKNHNTNQLFRQGGRLVLFNFDADRIETFSLRGDSLAAVPIAFNRAPRPDDVPIVHDEATGRFYAITWARGGYHLSEVDLARGTLDPPRPLDLARYQKLAVVNDRVYLLGVPLRDRASEYTRFLWRGL